MYLAKPAAKSWAMITFRQYLTGIRISRQNFNLARQKENVLNGTTKQSKDQIEIRCNILEKGREKKEQSKQNA